MNKNEIPKHNKKNINLDKSVDIQKLFLNQPNYDDIKSLDNINEANKNENEGMLVGLNTIIQDNQDKLTDIIDDKEYQKDSTTNFEQTKDRKDLKSKTNINGVKDYENQNLLKTKILTGAGYSTFFGNSLKKGIELGNNGENETIVNEDSKSISYRNKNNQKEENVNGKHGGNDISICSSENNNGNENSQNQNNNSSNHENEDNMSISSSGQNQNEKDVQNNTLLQEVNSANQFIYERTETFGNISEQILSEDSTYYESFQIMSLNNSRFFNEYIQNLDNFNNIADENENEDDENLTINLPTISLINKN